MTEKDGNNRVIWKHIGLHGHSVGTFSCEDNGIRWKSAVLGRDDSDVGLGGTSRFLPSKSLQGACQWTIFGRSGHLRIQIRHDKIENNKNELQHEYRFDGFPGSDYDLLKQTLRNIYSMDLQKYNMSASGTQYGLCKVSKKNLVFRHCILEEAEEEGEEYEPREGDEMMSLGLTEVSQCVLPGNNRNEIELQYPESDTIEAGTDQLVAIRFYIPPDPDVDQSDTTILSPGEALQQKITQTANIRKTTGNVIVEFDQSKGTFLTPRGRYGIELYDWFLRLRGPKYDYKIKYDDISRLFLLPKPDEVYMAFVIALDKPIRQGQQRYQYLVLQVTKDPDEVTVNLDEQTLKNEYNNELQPIMRGALSNLIAKTFKVIAKKKVFIPGKFANANQQSSVKCALRANEGFLYPLEKQFVFIHKPPLLIRFNEVESVEFQRYGSGEGSTRNFDLCVNLKSTATAAGQGTKEYTFSGIDRSDYAGLYNFLSGKKIIIKNLQEEEQQVLKSRRPVYNEDEIYGGVDADMEDESEDDDYDANDAENDEGSGGSSDEDDDIDDEDLGSEIDEDLDSDLEEARKSTKKKGKKQQKSKPPKITKKQDAGISKKRNPPPKKVRKQSDSSSDSESSKSDESTPPPKKKKKMASNAVIKKKVSKKKKDPNAPKKPMTGFMYYSKENRPIVVKDNPGMKFGDVAREVGNRFRALSEKEKAKYEEKAKQDKIRYQKEMENYSAPEDSSDDDSDEGAPKKIMKDPNAPKKVRSAYMYYVNANRAKIREKNPSLSFGELSKKVAQEYKAMSSDEKKKYEDMAGKDKLRYEREMKGYVPPKGTTKAGGKKAKKDPNMPKRAITSFMYFSSAYRPKIKQENPSISFGDMGKELGKRFRDLSPEEKEKYVRMSKKDKQRYQKEMDEYKKNQKMKQDEKDDDSNDDDSEDSDEDSDDESDDGSSGSDDDSDDSDDDSE